MCLCQSKDWIFAGQEYFGGRPGKVIIHGRNDRHHDDAHPPRHCTRAVLYASFFGSKMVVGELIACYYLHHISLNTFYLGRPPKGSLKHSEMATLF